MYSLKGLNRLLNEIKQKQINSEVKQRHKEMGYSPRCSVCNHELVDEIEQLHADGYGYEYIKEALNLEMSIMSLSRHFKNHYPQSQKYKLKKRIELLENVKDAYIKYPFLEDYFKNKELEDLEEFNEEYGFCLDRFGLCGRVAPCTVSNGTETVRDLYRQLRHEIEEIQNDPYGFMRKDEKIQETKNNYNTMVNYCLNCKNEIQEQRINLLERIITYNFLGIAPENKELYFSLLNFNGNKDEFIQIITPDK